MVNFSPRYDCLKLCYCIWRYKQAAPVPPTPPPKIKFLTSHHLQICQETSVEVRRAADPLQQVVLPRVNLPGPPPCRFFLGAPRNSRYLPNFDQSRCGKYTDVNKLISGPSSAWWCYTLFFISNLIFELCLELLSKFPTRGSKLL